MGGLKENSCASGKDCVAITALLRRFLFGQWANEVLRAVLEEHLPLHAGDFKTGGKNAANALGDVLRKGLRGAHHHRQALARISPLLESAGGA